MTRTVGAPAAASQNLCVMIRLPGGSTTVLLSPAVTWARSWSAAALKLGIPLPDADQFCVAASGIIGSLAYPK